MKAIRISWFPVILGMGITVAFLNKFINSTSVETVPQSQGATVNEWKAPDINLVPQTPEGDLIRYGRDLIVNTAKYFGPKGLVAPITNGMTCQNCHLYAGTKKFGNSFAAVASTYPRYRPRSARVESIEFRINDCMQRSLNGKSIDSLSREMRAMVAFFHWIGKDVPKGVKPAGSGIVEIPYLNRAADPEKGKFIFQTRCQSCHGANGEGQIAFDSVGYLYPPLWGPASYNTGAGLYRITRMAAFIYYNMPFDPQKTEPQLSLEEAWDVAAYISSQERPGFDNSNDWPDISTKPPDHPFGPFADGFSEKQHKYGPFPPIVEANKKKKP
jgi:thiosulfate dehydrogenase